MADGRRLNYHFRMTATHPSLAIAATDITIAELEGWSNLHRSVAAGGVIIGTSPTGAVAEPPRYTESRDACAEFEADMTDEEFRSYAEELCDLCGIGNPHDNPNLDYLEIRPLIQATAAQRCEAFLTIKGRVAGAVK